MKKKLSSRDIVKFQKYNEELDSEIEKSFIFAKEAKAPNEKELYTEILLK